MNYANGETILPGDVLAIDGQYCGQVVASMETADYLPGFEDWAYLGKGIMVNTDFAGLVHYTQGSTEELALIDRSRIELPPAQWDILHAKLDFPPVVKPALATLLNEPGVLR